MSDALPLPPRPDVDQYKKLAKDFQRACESGDPAAVHDWAVRWAQTITRLQGPAITPALRQQIAGEVGHIEDCWQKFQQSNDRAAQCTLADAQFLIARGHGFASWPRFIDYLEAAAPANSPVSQFEAAVNAIVTGDESALLTLLHNNPQLVLARSLRDHRSTLLHYVSANGVEDFRQVSPPNIVAIAKLLLDSGVDVNAESEAYSGRSTTLMLTATSAHPENAGVQIPLLQLLLDHGAAIDLPDHGSTVNTCLRNGRGVAAKFLADRGARLDLEGAAGVGRLDLVQQLQPSSSSEQIKHAFAWACQFGQIPVIEFFLDQGFDIATQPLPHHGQTGLHWAASSGELDTVRFLLQHHAPVNARDETFGGTPLGWTLYGWRNAPISRNTAHYYPIAALLVAAGATIEPDWLNDPKILADPQMSRALQPAK